MQGAALNWGVGCGCSSRASRGTGAGTRGFSPVMLNLLPGLQNRVVVSVCRFSAMLVGACYCRTGADGRAASLSLWVPS